LKLWLLLGNGNGERTREVDMAMPATRRVLLTLATTVCLATGLAYPTAHTRSARIPASGVTLPANAKVFTGDAAKLAATGIERHGDTSLNPAGSPGPP
jgi:hypothetical protein